MSELPVHFFTIVLNGEPYIRWHIEQLKQLPFPWVWHVVEGEAELIHDTAWCARNGGRIPLRKRTEWGLSVDGTTEYLSSIQGLVGDNGRVRINRKCCGKRWQGKIEMVREPLKFINEPCLLWEIDADELWLAEQIVEVRQMFLDHPEKTAALFRCRYFVGKDLWITNVDCYGNYPTEWLRVWRYQPGDHWARHEPPELMRNGKDVGKLNPFTHNETAGIEFQHFAYATEKQLAFKEVFYGYKGALRQWKKLQARRDFPVLLGEYFAWVKDDARVGRASECGILPLIDL